MEAGRKIISYYTAHILPRKGGRLQQGQAIHQLPETLSAPPLPRAETSLRTKQETHTKKALNLLTSLSESELKDLGIDMDMDIVGAQ